MPRKRKQPINYAEQIQQIDLKIEKYSSHLSSLKEKRKALSDLQAAESMKSLQDYMAKNNITSEEILAKLEIMTASSDTVLVRV